MTWPHRPSTTPKGRKFAKVPFLQDRDKGACWIGLCTIAFMLSAYQKKFDYNIQSAWYDLAET